MAALAALGAPPVPKVFATMEEGPSPGGDNPAEAWLESHGRSLGHWVAGAWLRPAGRESLECPGGAAGRPLAVVPAGDPSDVAVAVAAAAAAAGEWAGLGGPERGRCLSRLAAALSGAPGVTLGTLLTVAGARPLCRTLGSELGPGLRLLQGLGRGAQLGHSGLEGWTPRGVVAVVVSGQLSLPELLGTLGPLLAMGNPAVLLCPPPAAPPLLFLAELFGEGASLPPGVLNVLAGPPGLARTLRHHPEVTCVTFPGTPQEELRAQVWGSPFRGPHLGVPPGGGGVVVIVLDSADLDSAAAAIAGHLAGSVVLAQDSVLAPLQRRLRARLGGLRLGDPRDPRPEEAQEEGAQIFQPPPPHFGGRPLLRDPISQPPGPLLLLLSVRAPAEAAAVAATLPKIAAASLWAQDITTALDVADRLPQALVWINELQVPGAGGGTDPELEEAMREFGRPPWEDPPKTAEPLSPPLTLRDPDDPELAQAVAAARGALPAWAGPRGAWRAQVFRRAAEALGGARGTPEGGSDSGDSRDSGRSLQEELLRWAALAERAGGAVQDLPGGRGLVTRKPLGVVGVAWAWPRPLAIRLLLPPVALGNSVVALAPPGGSGDAQRLRKALVAAGLPEGALTLLPQNSGGSGSRLARQRPDGLWLCGEGADCEWSSALSAPRIWGVPAAILGCPGRAPPPSSERELELRCSRPQCLWIPGGRPETPSPK